MVGAVGDLYHDGSGGLCELVGGSALGVGRFLEKQFRSGRLCASLLAKLLELWLQQRWQGFFDQQIHQEIELFEVSEGFLFLFVFFDVTEVCAIGFEGDGWESQDQEAKQILGLLFFAGIELIKGGAKPADTLCLVGLGGMDLV